MCSSLTDGQRGWPVIQIQIINELVAAANRMGNPALATRHLTFLLQTMYNHLTSIERKDIALQLQNVSQQCEGAPVPLVCYEDYNDTNNTRERYRLIYS